MFLKALKNNLPDIIALTGAIVMAYWLDHGSRGQSIALLGYAFAYIVGLFCSTRRRN